jgi:hypothetical protein
VPIARYFVVVGGTIAALLFISGWLLPEAPAMFVDQSVAIDRAVIRIKSAHKWPEKVVLDTGQLTVKIPVIVDSPAIQPSSQLPSDKAPHQSNLETMALFKPDTRPTAVKHSTLQIKRGAARTGRSKRVARGTVRDRRVEMGRFGSIDSGQSSSNAFLSGRTISLWPSD